MDEKTTAFSAHLARCGAMMLFASASISCAPTISRYAARSAAADTVIRTALARERTIQATDLPSNTIGVMPLTVVSADTTYASLGYGVAALMASDLARSKSLIVVERLRLDAVLRELDLVKSGRVDTLTAPRLGRIVGARRLVVGALDIGPTGNLRLGSQVANSSSGIVDASFSGDATIAKIFDAEKAMVFRILEALGVRLSPIERRAIERRPTPTMSAFVAYSNGVRAELARDFQGAATSYNSAARLDPTFSVARASSAAVLGAPIDPAGAPSGQNRAALISTNLVNRPAPVLVGSGVDTPVTRQQLLTITISVRTP